MTEVSTPSVEVQEFRDELLALAMSAVYEHHPQEVIAGLCNVLGYIIGMTVSFDVQHPEHPPLLPSDTVEDLVQKNLELGRAFYHEKNAGAPGHGPRH